MLTAARHALTSGAKKRRCPDCGESLVKRSSESKHPLLSSTYLICKNPICGATFVGVDQITHRLSPPSQANPEIDLPYSPLVARRTARKALDSKSKAGPGSAGTRSAEVRQ